jgi:class 3 adenylate cyclase
MVHYTHFLFYEAIINFARIKFNKSESDGVEMDVIKGNLEQMRSFAEPGPFNLLHKVQILNALVEWLHGNYSEAQKLFHDSLSEAKDKEFYQNAAIAHELMAEFWKDLDQSMYVKAHTVEAYQNYLIWGADSIAKELRSENPAFFRDSADTATFSLSQSAVSGSLHGGALDLMSVVKASQAIYGEIDVDTLLKRLIQVVMQNAGASRLVLFLEKKGEWILEADGSDDSISTPRVALHDLENSIPKSLINYAIRTQEEVLINDTSEEHLFTRDAYLKKSGPASIWAIPLYAKNKMNGLLYLENKIASNAFTSKRQQVIRLLTAQITISIENAYLYWNLKQLNTAYQKFVPLEFLSLLGHTSILDVALGDQTERNLTVMFLDIRDYTTISESMSPEENFNFINAFLAKVFPIIDKHKGSVNQLLGDGIMSLFENPNDCLRSAIEIQHTMENYNEEREKENLDRLRVGIGMHSGRTMIGIIGDHKRHDTGVISKVVNTASRVEGLTKVFGASIVLSEDTLAGIVNPELYNYRFLGIVQVKGTQEPIKVYEFFDGDPLNVRDLKKATEKDFTRGLKEYFKKDFVMAAAHLKKVLATNPGDRTANRYFRHAAQYMINGVDDDWTGVERMEVK